MGLLEVLGWIFFAALAWSVGCVVWWILLAGWQQRDGAKPRS